MTATMVIMRQHQRRHGVSPSSWIEDAENKKTSIAVSLVPATCATRNANPIFMLAALQVRCCKDEKIRINRQVWGLWSTYPFHLRVAFPPCPPPLAGCVTVF